MPLFGSEIVSSQDWHWSSATGRCSMQLVPHPMSHTPLPAPPAITAAPKGEPRPARRRRAVLASTCAFVLACGPASWLAVSDAERAGDMAAQEQTRGAPVEYAA